MRRMTGWFSCAGGLFVLALAAGCVQKGVGTLYLAERDLWRAAKLERESRIGPETPPTPDESERVLTAYRHLLDRNPLPSQAADTALVHALGRVHAQAYMGLVRMHRVRDEGAQAREWLEKARKAFPWSTDLTLRFAQDLAEDLRASGELERASEIYQEIASSLPARLPNGQPVVAVQDAPIRAADILSELGRRDEAQAEYDRAEAYYRSLIQENPNDAAAALAWLEIGTVAARRGDYDKAAAALERARRSPGAGAMEPRILLVLGTVQQEQRKDAEAAAALFLELADRFPDDAVAPEALIRRAAALSDLRRQDEALAVLQDLRDKYPRDKASGAKGELLAARILARADRWTEALSRYRALMADFPTSSEAINAPFEIEAGYRQMGESDAAKNTMERALEQYADLRVAYPGSSIAWMSEESAARALLRLGRHEEAITKLLAIPDAYPRDPRNGLALIEAARIAHDLLKDPNRAADILDQIVARYPDSAMAERAQAEAKRLRGE